MKNYTYILLLLASLLGLGCPGPEEVPTYYVSQEMLRYCWFPDGSYWIYEEDSTPGLLDSVYVSNSYEEILPDYGEGFKMQRLTNRLILEGESYMQGRTAWPSSEGFTVTIMIQKRSDLAGPEEDAVFFWDEAGSTTLSYHPSTRILGTFDTITVGNAIYHDAIEVGIDSSYSFYELRTIFVRNVGVVHRSMKNGSSWSLVRHHIN